MKRNYLVGYKVFFSLLGFSAIVTEVAVLWANGKLVPGNFFSFFTIEANIIAAVIFLVSAFFVFAGKKSTKLDFFRGAATFYMVVTGIVFSVLLSGIEGVDLTAVPWDNVVLHYIIPIAIALDWITDSPSRRIAFKKSLLWLVFPLVYLIYSLIRGPIVGFYPYPFLNPANGGYGQVAITSVCILIGGFVLVYIVTRNGVKKKH
ncbi:MAG: hypothetical protein JWO99_668 [Candidatus Saccharibacteria bacterium]|nr:hypothetical protein [Candidatus Saccharibacteria bacterium]